MRRCLDCKGGMMFLMRPAQMLLRDLCPSLCPVPSVIASMRAMTSWEVDDLALLPSSAAASSPPTRSLASGVIQCEDKPKILEKPNQCASFALSAEVYNLRNWTLPQDCITNAEIYIGSGQYYVDFALAIDAARTYLRSVVVESDGRDLLVLDLDDTMLSSLPLLRLHHFGAEYFKQDVWDGYVNLAKMPPLDPMLSLYKELKALNWSIAIISDRDEGQRNATVTNLNSAGYKDYILILRSEPGPIVDFKSKSRLELEKQGFRLWAGIGDQWSDLTGQAVGKRTFKLPNSLYYA